MSIGNENRINKIDVQISVHAKLGVESEDLAEKHFKASSITSGKVAAFDQSIELIDTIFSGFFKNFKDTKTIEDENSLIHSTKNNLVSMITRLRNDAYAFQLVQQGQGMAHSINVKEREKSVAEYEKQKQELINNPESRIERSRRLAKERKLGKNKDKN